MTDDKKRKCNQEDDNVLNAPDHSNKRVQRAENSVIIHVQAPDRYDFSQHLDSSVKPLTIFLAGGISGCPDWQEKLVGLIRKDEDTLANGQRIILINPRRENFQDRPDVAKQQITWEYEYLQQADAVSFWFPCETLCPITLFELGCCATAGKPIFVGTHADYSRKLDVDVQMSLRRPDVSVVHTLEDLARQILAGIPSVAKTAKQA
eukprot:TRINITY_DN9079_c0_g1::TRINITY_DN9079_c0_g1_i1::g.18282::m.18282 TRINITY_DN9079_c0_g1::TRINITY_DN9079_c0_g1_i1::g.18282  ORF type:complete len:223 (+),score=13.90,Nuc_deoxyrib_tr/PF05014.10/4.6e+03,Nuc_deoxyrib_tr/PF05014.10/0.017 TRINITY_DN9079_c0_g1_i1:52-669(+)